MWNVEDRTLIYPISQTHGCIDKKQRSNVKQYAWFI